MPTAPTRSATRLGLLLGYLAVYLIWGSTYLAIRIGVETFPPFLMAATRFVIPGLALILWARSRGAAAPTGRQWRSCLIAGNLLLLGGNGLVTWAEQWVPSGLTALLIASVPLWMGLLNWLVEPTARPRARGIAGIALGFSGVALLVDPAGGLVEGTRMLVGAGAILVASLLWACGSLYSRHADLPEDLLLSTGMQMFGGAAGLAITGSILGEWGQVEPSIFAVRSILALAYLIVFGSIVAFSAYVWLLQVSAPAKVATYAYVNPVVAVLLGWAVASEAMTGRTIVAAAVIVTAVVMITTEKPRAKAPLATRGTREAP